MISEPSSIAIPRDRITPPRYNGLRLIRKGPSVTNLLGISWKSIAVFLFFNSLTDQVFRANPSRMNTNPKYVYGEWTILLMGRTKCSPMGNTKNILRYDGGRSLSLICSPSRWSGCPYSCKLLSARLPITRPRFFHLISLISNYLGYASARYWISSACSSCLSWAPFPTMRSTVAFHSSSVFLARSTRPRSWHWVHRS